MSQHLVVELLPLHYQIHLLSYDLEHQIISHDRSWAFSDLAGLKKFLGNAKNIKNKSIVIVLDTDSAVTNFAFYDFFRRAPHQPINEAEVESLVAQLVSRFLNERRALDYHLQQLHLRSFLIDGHKAVDPLKLSGEKIRFYFSKTFIKRALARELQAILPLESVKLVGDAGALWAHAISQAVALEKTAVKNFLLVPMFYDNSPFYWINGQHIERQGVLKWGERNFLSILFGQLGLSAADARMLLLALRNRRLSPASIRRLNNFWQAEFSGLTANLQRPLKKNHSSRVYCLPLFNLPELQLRLPNRIRAVAVDNQLIGQKLGFKLKFNYSAGVDDHSAASLSLIESLLIPSDNLLNKIASRRLRWYNLSK